MTRSAAPPDGSLEQKFRHCGLAPTLLQSEWVCAGFVALNAVLGVTEGTAGFSAGAVGAVAACRVTAATLALTSLALIRRARRETGSRVRLEALVVTSWSAQLLCAAVAAGAAATLGPPGATSPFSALQWWSSAWGMTHAVLMLASGLRAPLIAALAAAQAVSTAGGFAAPWSAPDPTVVASFVLLVLGCVYVAFSHEATSRAGFLALASASADGALHERLVEGLLPWHVRALVLPSPPLVPTAAAAVLADLPDRIAGPFANVGAASPDAAGAVVEPDSTVMRWRSSRSQQAPAVPNSSDARGGDGLPGRSALSPPALDSARSATSAGGGMRRISISTRSPLGLVPAPSSANSARHSGPIRGRIRVGSDGDDYGATPDRGGLAESELRGRRRVSVVRVGGPPNRSSSIGEDDADAPESISGAVARSVSSVMSSARSDDSTGGGPGNKLHSRPGRSGDPPADAGSLPSSRAAVSRFSEALSVKPARNSSAEGGGARVQMSAVAADRHGSHHSSAECEDNWDARRLSSPPNSVPASRLTASPAETSRQRDGVVLPSVECVAAGRAWSASIPAACLAEAQRPSSGRGAVEHLVNIAVPASPPTRPVPAAAHLRRASSSAPSRKDPSSANKTLAASRSGIAHQVDSHIQRPESAGAVALEAKPPSHPAFHRGSPRPRLPPVRPRRSSHVRAPAFDLSAASSQSHNDGARSGSSGQAHVDMPLKTPTPGAEVHRGTSIFFDPLPAGGLVALSAIAHHIDELTVTFVAIANIDAMSYVADDPRDLVASLNALFTVIDDVVDANACYKIMVAGGCYMFVSGGFDSNLQHASTAARAALEIMCVAVRDSAKFGVAGITPIIQIGLNTGPVAAAVLGTRAVNWSLFGGERWGYLSLGDSVRATYIPTLSDTVNVASRMCSGSLPFHVQVSPSTAERLRSDNSFRLMPRGPTLFKGKGLLCTSWLSNHTLEITLERRVAAALGSAPVVTHDVLSSHNPSTVLAAGVLVSSDPSRRGSLSPTAVAVTPAPPITIPTSQPCSAYSPDRSKENEPLFESAEDEVSYRSLSSLRTTRSLLLAVFVFVVTVLCVYGAQPFDTILLVALLGVAVITAAGAVCLMWAPRTSSSYTAGAATFRPIDALICTMAVIFVVVVNAMKSAGDAAGLATVTFALLSLVSFFDLTWTVLVLADAACVIVYVATVAAQDDPVLVARVVVVCTGAVLAVALGVLRGAPGRSEFIAQRRAERLLIQCQKLLALMLPTKKYVERLMRGETVVEILEDATLLFSDIRGFTAMTANLDPDAVVTMLHELYSRFDQHLVAFNLWKIDTIGDAMVVLGSNDLAVVGEAAPSEPVHPDAGEKPPQRLADLDLTSWLQTTFGLSADSSHLEPATGMAGREAAVVVESSVNDCSYDIDWAQPPPASKRRALSAVGAVALFALDMLREVETMRHRYAEVIDTPLEIRIGIHTGTVAGGIIGRSRPHFEIFGKDALFAQSLEASGAPGTVQVSERTARALYFEGFTLHPYRQVSRLGTSAPAYAAGGGAAAQVVPGAPAMWAAPRASIQPLATSEWTYLLDAFQFTDFSAAGAPRTVQVNVGDFSRVAPRALTEQMPPGPARSGSRDGVPDSADSDSDA